MPKSTWLLYALLLFIGPGVRREPVPPRLTPPKLPTIVELKPEDAVLPAHQPDAPVTRETEIRRLFASRDYAEALKLIEGEIQANARNKAAGEYLLWLDRQRYIVKTALAWTYLDKQNCAKALDILGEIPASKMPDLALKASGYCKLMGHDLVEADNLVTQYTKNAPGDKEGLGLLIKVKEAEGLYDEAMDITARMDALNQSNDPGFDLEPLKKSLAAKQSESLSQQQMESGYFRVHYPPNVGPDFVERVVAALQRTATKLNLAFGVDYPSQTIEVYFHTREMFGDITHSPEWAAGIYDGQIQLPLGAEGQWSEALERTIRHEVTHALLAEMVGRRNLPTWFQEGFAQLAECDNICDHYEFVATTQKFFPLDKFEQPFMGMATREAQVAYRQSLYLAMMLNKHQGEANMKQMFSLLSGVENLTSEEIVQQSAWTFKDLHWAAMQAWNNQQSL